MKPGQLVLMFESDVRAILKLSTEAVQVRQQMITLVESMRSSGILYSEGTREFKKTFIGHVLEKNRGNQSRAARELGMHRNTLSRTISELNLKVDDYVPQRKPIGSQNISAIQEARRA